MCKNIKVVDDDLINNYTIVNHDNNENHYIVVNSGSDDEYIEYLLLNIDIYSYLKKEYYQNFLSDWYKYDYLNDFDKALLNNFDLKYINGFLYIEYNEDDIYNFLDKYEKYFVKDLKIDLIKLYNNLINEIKRI